MSDPQLRGMMDCLAEGEEDREPGILFETRPSLATPKAQGQDRDCIRAFTEEFLFLLLR